MADLNLDDLAIFVRVVDSGGFAATARGLGVPTSTVSRAIERIEASANVRLFQRTTRTMMPTHEARELYASVAPGVSTLRSAVRAFEPASRKPKGRVRIAAPNEFAATFLADVIVAFKAHYPLVDLEFSLTNQHANIVHEGFDIAVRAAVRLSDSTLVARRLGELQHRLYASPSYLQKHGAPSSAQDLERHACVVFRAKDLAKTWSLESAAGATRVDVKGAIGGDDFSFVRAIVRAGGGIGLLPRVNCAADEASGALVRVLPEFHARGATLYLLYPSVKNLPTRVVAFRDFVVAAFESWSASRGGETAAR